MDAKYPSGLGKIRIKAKGIIEEFSKHGKACTSQKSRRNRDPSPIY